MHVVERETPCMSILLVAEVMHQGVTERSELAWGMIKQLTFRMLSQIRVIRLLNLGRWPLHSKVTFPATEYIYW
jgi:hypothetical protein